MLSSCPFGAATVDACRVGSLRVSSLGRGTRYLDNLDLALEVDGGQLFDVDGLKLFVYGIYNNGHAFSGELSGDAQGVSNTETDRAMRVMEAWAEFALSPRSSLRCRRA